MLYCYSAVSTRKAQGSYSTIMPCKCRLMWEHFLVAKCQRKGLSPFEKPGRMILPTEIQSPCFLHKVLRNSNVHCRRIVNSSNYWKLNSYKSWEKLNALVHCSVCFDSLRFFRAFWAPFQAFHNQWLVKLHVQFSLLIKMQENHQRRNWIHSNPSKTVGPGI